MQINWSTKTNLGISDDCYSFFLSLFTEYTLSITSKVLRIISSNPRFILLSSFILLNILYVLRCVLFYLVDSAMDGGSHLFYSDFIWNRAYRLTNRGRDPNARRRRIRNRVGRIPSPAVLSAPPSIEFFFFIFCFVC